MPVMEHQGTQHVLPYEAPRPQQRRGIWIALGIGVAAGVAGTLALLNVGGATNVKTARPFVGGASGAPAIVVRPPRTVAPSPTEAQDAGELITNSDGIGFPYGRFVFAADRDHLVAIRATCPSGIGRAISYEWIESADGTAAGLNAAGAKRGKGAVVEKGGSGWIRAGSFNLQWSQGSTTGGWLYWPGSQNFAVASATVDGMSGVAKALSQTEWHDRQGRTPDPRTPAPVGPAPGTPTPAAK